MRSGSYHLAEHSPIPRNPATRPTFGLFALRMRGLGYSNESSFFLAIQFITAVGSTLKLCVREMKRTIGPLDKRKKVTRCQSCAKRRIKVRHINPFDQEFQSSLSYLNSVKEVIPASTASEQGRRVNCKG